MKRFENVFIFIALFIFINCCFTGCQTWDKYDGKDPVLSNSFSDNSTLEFKNNYEVFSVNNSVFSSFETIFAPANINSETSFKLEYSYEQDNKYYYCLRLGTLKNVIIDDETIPPIIYPGEVSIQRRFTKSRLSSTTIQQKTETIKSRLVYDNNLKSANISAGLSVSAFGAAVGVNLSTGVEYYQNTTTTSASISESTITEKVIQHEEQLTLYFDRSCAVGSYRVCNVTDFEIFMMVECPKNASKLTDYTVSYDAIAYKRFHERYEYSPSLTGFDNIKYDVQFDEEKLLNLPIPKQKVDNTASETPVQKIVFDANSGWFQEGRTKVYFNIINDDFSSVIWPTTPTRSGYFFVGWSYDGTSTWNSSLLKEYILAKRIVGNTQNITLKAKWISNTFKLTSNERKTVTDTASEVYYTFDVKSLKEKLIKYNLRVRNINIKFYVEEVDDGYQEFYLVKTRSFRWQDHTHKWSDSDIIVHDYKFETKTSINGPGCDWYERDFLKYINDSDFPSNNICYLFLGAQGNDKDTWICSNVSISFSLEVIE